MAVATTARGDTRVSSCTMANKMVLGFAYRNLVRALTQLCTDDNDDGHNNRNYQRRRHEPPVPIRMRKQLLAIADSPLRRWHEEITGIANMLAENVGDADSDNHDPQLRETFVSLVCQLAVEQPLKTPFVAAVVLVVNTLKPEIAFEVVRRVAENTTEAVGKGEWRAVKLNLKFLACLQSCLEGEGVFPVLEELFNRAGELQASNENDVSAEVFAGVE